MVLAGVLSPHRKILRKMNFTLVMPLNQHETIDTTLYMYRPENQFWMTYLVYDLCEMPDWYWDGEATWQFMEKHETALSELLQTTLPTPTTWTYLDTRQVLIPAVMTLLRPPPELHEASLSQQAYLHRPENQALLDTLVTDICSTPDWQWDEDDTRRFIERHYREVGAIIHRTVITDRMSATHQPWATRRSPSLEAVRTLIRPLPVSHYHQVYIHKPCNRTVMQRLVTDLGASPDWTINETGTWALLHEHERLVDLVMSHSLSVNPCEHAYALARPRILPAIRRILRPPPPPSVSKQDYVSLPEHQAVMDSVVRCLCTTTGWGWDEDDTKQFIDKHRTAVSVIMQTQLPEPTYWKFLEMRPRIIPLLMKIIRPYTVIDA